MCIPYAALHLAQGIFMMRKTQCVNRIDIINCLSKISGNCHCGAFFVKTIPLRNSGDCFVTANTPRNDASENLFGLTLINY